jgi:ribosomal protein S18 acetylase RimI-like enzyme
VKSRATIREAGVGDYSRCFPLLDSLYHGEIGEDLQKTFESYLRSDNAIVLIAVSRYRAVGVLIGSLQMDIDWEGMTAKIDAIAVSREHRGMGIGRHLVNRFVTLAQRRGCKAVKSRVGTKNRASCRFHESLGFSKAPTFEYMLDLRSST